MSYHTTDYFRPKTLAKCHERIDDILHTNKMQAEDIGKLKAEAEQLKLQKTRAEAEKNIAVIRHKNLLAEFRALKDMLRMLGREVMDE